MPIAHTTLIITDLQASKAFYTAALAPLNYKPMMEFGASGVGFGTPTGKVDFWLRPSQGSGFTAQHLAFYGDSEEMVKAFHAAALRAGAKDNGAPGPRPQYGPDYYGSFVLDLDGNNMECVYFKDRPQ